MPAPAGYQVLILNKDGTTTVEFNQAINLAWEWYENEVGTCVFTIPWNDPKLTSSNLSDAAFSEIRIYRKEPEDATSILVWQGFVAYIVDDSQGTTVYGLTYLECLKWYRVGFNTTYTAANIGSGIIDPIYDVIVAYTNDILGERITKGTIQNPYQTGSSTVAKTLTKTVFDEDFFTILQDMVAASRADSPSGSWVQNTVFEITFSTTPTFNFWRNVGSDKSDMLFELDSEITDFSFGTDLRFIYNDIKGFALASGTSTLTSNQIDTTSRTTFYRRDLSPYLGTVTGQAQLDELSKNLLKEQKDPIKTFAIKFTSNLAPFDGYSMGDSVRVRIKRGRVDVNQFFRVVGMEVQVSDSGVESVNPVLEVQRT